MSYSFDYSFDSENNILYIGSNNETQYLDLGENDYWPWDKNHTAQDIGDGNYENIKHIKFLGNIIGSSSLKNLFKELNKLESVDFLNLDTDNVKDMGSMFYECRELINVDMSYLSFKSITNLSFMFFGCSSLEKLNLITPFNTVGYVNEIRNLHSMFYGCTKLQRIDFGKINLSSCTNLSYLFRGCSHIQKIDLTKITFNNSNGADIDRMFYGCSSLNEILVKPGTDLSNSLSISDTFYGCSSLPGYTPSKITGVYAKIENGYFSIEQEYDEFDNVLPESIGWVKDSNGITLFKNISTVSESVLEVIQDVTKYGTAFGGIYDTTKNWYGVQCYSPVFFNNSFPRYDWDVDKDVNLNGSYASGFITNSGTELHLDIPTGHIWRQSQSEKKIYNLTLVLRCQGGYIRMQHGQNNQIIPLGSSPVSIIKDGVLDKSAQNVNGVSFSLTDTDFSELPILYQAGLSSHVRMIFSKQLKLLDATSSANNYPVFGSMPKLEVKIHSAQ